MGGIFNYTYYNVIAWNKSGGYERFAERLLECDVIDVEYEYLLFLKFDNHTEYSIPDLDDLIDSLDKIYSKISSPFIILTPRKTAPILTASEDEFVYSFSCRIDLFNKLIKSIQPKNSLSSTELLFELFDHLITISIDREDILIRQIPITDDFVSSTTCGDVIIPHRGDNDFLHKALRLLTHIEGLSIFVGIDQEITEQLQVIMDEFPHVNFYSFTPNPIGPYVIRNRLIECSTNNLQFFHDSDDISCKDRFEKIAGYMNNNDCEYCGSHELRVDYYNRTLQSVRFPKDASQALASAPWFPLLHPTSAITRDAFYRCGTLSEERIFGNDTKFLLNSFFYIPNINNVDEFLYIRRIHPGSLTTSEETKLGSPIRLELTFRWNYDFQLIKMGLLELDKSNLIFYPTSLIVDFFKTSGSSP